MCNSFTSKSETVSPAIKMKYLGCQGDANVKPWVWIIRTYITLDAAVNTSNAFTLMGEWKQGQQTALKLMGQGRAHHRETAGTETNMAAGKSKLRAHILSHKYVDRESELNIALVFKCLASKPASSDIPLPFGHQIFLFDLSKATLQLGRGANIQVPEIMRNICLSNIIVQGQNMAQSLRTI